MEHDDCENMTTLMAMLFCSIQIVEGSLMYMVVTRMDTYILPMDNSRKGARCLDVERVERSSIEGGLLDTLRWDGDTSLLILSDTST